MLTNFPSFDFLNHLTHRVKFRDSSTTAVEGCGRQAVVVTEGESAYKVFADNGKCCGTKALQNEAHALAHFGGYEGDVIRTPVLKSHFMFSSPFRLDERNYVGVIEQSRVAGHHPTLSSPYQQAAIGDALAEFHTLLENRPGGDFNRDILGGRMSLLRNRKSRAGHLILPSLRKRLLANVSKIAMTGHLQRVHGDFHPGNVLFDADKFAIIDLATVGKSVIEQDMTIFAHDPDKLNHVFKSYARRSGKKPSTSRTMTLYALDLAIATETAHQNGEAERAQKHLDRLNALMS